MTLYLLFLCFTVFCFAYALALIDSMHFFQLNTYRFDTHVKWMRQNLSRFMPHNVSRNARSGKSQRMTLRLWRPNDFVPSTI